MRLIARALTACRRSSNSSASRPRSLRATSSRAWLIAKGVRSSCEALAANLCCSATCASSRSSMVSKASASSRSSSCLPDSRIRCDSEPLAAIRVAAVIRVRGASMRPASSHPPTRPNTSRNAITTAALGAKTWSSRDRMGNTSLGKAMSVLPGMIIIRSGTYLRRNTHTAASSRVPASIRNPA